VSAAHDHLRRLLFGPAAADEKPHWAGIVGALHTVAAERSEESEALLRSVLTDFRGHLELEPSEGLPHAMPPEDLLRSVAVQTLAAWDLPRHRDAILPHADPARNDPLGSIARRALAV